MKVLYFASMREITGKSEENVEATTINELIKELEVKYKVNASYFLYAIHEEYTRDYNQRIADNQTVAVIPPVSGG